MKKIAVRAPGRVCLFGDHQDYLGLPIIACAINRYMAFRAIPNGKEYFEMVLPDVGQTRIIYIDPEQQKSEKPIDFFRGWAAGSKAPWMCSFGRAYGNPH